MNQSTNFLEFRLRVADLKSEWERCSLLANYVGQSTSHEFKQSEYAENLIATVINEVLEMITEMATEESSVSVWINPENEGLKVTVCFTSRKQLESDFKGLLDEIKQNSQDIYFGLLEPDNGTDHHFNQLGLAMLVHDFGADIMIAPASNNDNQLCILIQIPGEEFAV